MQLKCRCGSVISDTTDKLPYKASYIADQDLADLLEGMADAVQKELASPRPGEKVRDTIAGAIWRAPSRIYRYRHLYQCDRCGRLYLKSDNRYLSFKPEHRHVRGTSDLRSIHGALGKRTLSGTWIEERGKGNLFWSAGVEDSGWKRFDRWEDLERAYHVVFERLKSQDLLRSALLQRDGTHVHTWPPSE